MITELTPAQSTAIPSYVDKWIKRGTDTTRLDYDKTVEIINKVQVNVLKRKATPVVIVDNPVEAWVACNLFNNGSTKIKDLVLRSKDLIREGNKEKVSIETYSSPYLCGSFDAPIFAFYDFFQNEVGIDFGDVTENYNTWQATYELGLIFPLHEVCIVSQKPTAIHLNEAKVAHKDGGPAISFAGEGNMNIFMLNGVRVPDWLAVTRHTQLTVQQYNEITNADQRMEFVKKVGIERMLETGKKIDSYTNYTNEWWNKSEYELWDMNHLFQGIAYAPHLKMKNQTVGVWHVEAVSPQCNTLAAAIKERLGGEFDIVAIA